MDEDDFVERVACSINQNLPKEYICKKYANIFYQIELDNNLKPMVKFDEEPKRGRSAFETDLCIFLKKMMTKRYPKQSQR